jgi:2-polyprenyl-6-methoxyphenol hydroxylase-like FAD-dependent oxidoreductase
MGNGLFCIGEQQSSEHYELRVVFTKHTLEGNDWEDSQSPIITPIEEDLKEFDPQIKQLLHLGSSYHQTQQKILNLKTYCDDNYSTVLVGDAAGDGFIHGDFNFSLAIEDGYMLGFLFSQIRSKVQIAFVLKGYHDVRRQRVAVLQNHEASIIQMLTLPPGPQWEMRAKMFSHTLHKDDLTDDDLRVLWHDYIVQNDYDALDAVKEWWHNWGRLMS